MSFLPNKIIESRLREAVRHTWPDADTSTVLVRPCPDPKFGEYQSSAVISFAKARKLNPRQAAADVLAKLDVSEWSEPVEIAGPGFLNFRLKSDALAATLSSAGRGQHLFFEKAAHPQKIIIDFSSPNVAKPMHVGHIRSTILGDALARALRSLGHHVITDNHIGDWGTQFGKLLLGWQQQLDPIALKNDPIAEMERLYKTVNAAGENDPGVLDQARRELVQLQRGDPGNLRIWREMIALSQTQFDSIYHRLRVHFDHTLGESFYNEKLQGIVQELFENGIARMSEGAMAVFFEDQPQLKASPALIQKSDGAFNYTTTDLATLAYRLETWHPDQIIYVTGGPQQLHFQQVFAIFHRWHPEAKTKLAHVWFGSILGEDGKPFKTRSGDTVRLADLLDEAEERALKVVGEKNPNLEPELQREIARVVGISAIKYADLLPNRQSDYVFSWDKMLALNGNTAPYLLYAYARIRSIFRKAQEEGIAKPDSHTSAGTDSLSLQASEEFALARHLLNFGFVLEMAADEYRPNLLCNYLYELAGHFTRFYEHCPVLKSEPGQRVTRFLLCELTARVLKQGLEVLGIETLEIM